ncbi:hypothetical protein ACFQZI_15700 [Mucilaginibacter lutimaris]|uniref:WYL domain-containing protein n=1 Tax=Mucilaginibacter lutimaris TaxID=931629 RepID=A0ABW2ZJN5_9SPHI
MQVLREVSGLLKHFSHFNDLNEIVSKLGDKIYTQTTQSAPVVDFEKNDNLKGLEWIECNNQTFTSYAKANKRGRIRQNFSIRVIMNFELERELLGFGSKIRVLSPRIIVKQIKKQLYETLESYKVSENPSSDITHK